MEDALKPALFTRSMQGTHLESAVRPTIKAATQVLYSNMLTTEKLHHRAVLDTWISAALDKCSICYKGITGQSLPLTHTCTQHTMLMLGDRSLKHAGLPLIHTRHYANARGPEQNLSLQCEHSHHKHKHTNASRRTACLCSKSMFCSIAPN